MTNCFGKGLFILLTVRVFRKRVSICVCASFPFGSEGGICHMIVLIPDHSFFIYFSL